MKAKLILINWVLSFAGLWFVEPFWATMCGAGWFILSCWLLIIADRKGWMKAFHASKLGRFLDTEE
jgi:hypothetical protein